jgi:hypothetical protein
MSYSGIQGLGFSELSALNSAASTAPFVTGALREVKFVGSGSGFKNPRREIGAINPNGPKPPPGGYGGYLRSKIGAPPADMPDPHAHHIVFKEGLGLEQKALVKEGHDLLREYDIDPILGLENLTWAPNRVAGQHGVEALRNAVDNLKAVKQFGGTREDIIEKLRELGELAARRRNP